jgi:hypothetical protein
MANKQQQKPTNFEHHNMGHTFLPKYQFHHICGSEKNTFFLKFKSIRGRRVDVSNLGYSNLSTPKIGKRE